MLHKGKLRQGALLQGHVSVLWQGQEEALCVPPCVSGRDLNQGRGPGKPRGVGGTQNATLASFPAAPQGCACPRSGLLGDSQTCCARCFPGTERPEQR